MFVGAGCVGSISVVARDYIEVGLMVSEVHVSVSLYSEKSETCRELYACVMLHRS